MRSLFSRSRRLGAVAGLAIALAVPALALAAGQSRLLATQTTLTTETHDRGSRTSATLSVAVSGENGLPGAGAVSINDHGKPLAGIVLDAQGRATATFSLLPGSHNLSATYAGDSTHQPSVSPVAAVQGLTGTTPDFGVSIAPATISLTAGQSGSAIVSITPINPTSLTAPMFVTLSCSGLPDQSACTFTPENVELLENVTSPVTSSLDISTQAQSLAKAIPVAHSGSHPAVLAILLPGALLLAGAAFGARRRRVLSRLASLALVGFIAVLGATACAPLYNYRNHGPTPNLPTPAGTYTITVNAQSSNGITATTHSTTFALTVK